MQLYGHQIATSQCSHLVSISQGLLTVSSVMEYPYAGCCTVPQWAQVDQPPPYHCYRQVFLLARDFSQSVISGVHKMSSFFFTSLLLMKFDCMTQTGLVTSRLGFELNDFPLQSWVDSNQYFQKPFESWIESNLIKKQDPQYSMTK